jgi:hypothetical protein
VHDGVSHLRDEKLSRVDKLQGDIEALADGLDRLNRRLMGDTADSQASPGIIQRRKADMTAQDLIALTFEQGRHHVAISTIRATTEPHQNP